MVLGFMVMNLMGIEPVKNSRKKQTTVSWDHVFKENFPPFLHKVSTKEFLIILKVLHEFRQISDWFYYHSIFLPMKKY